MFLKNAGKAVGEYAGVATFGIDLNGNDLQAKTEISLNAR